jgi:hypothetical protein
MCVPELSLLVLLVLLLVSKVECLLPAAAVGGLASDGGSTECSGDCCWLPCF